MTIKELIDSGLFKTINIGDDTDRNISGLFCCDLLSIAMSKAPEDSVWVTVMGNINTLAVAALCDVAALFSPRVFLWMMLPGPRLSSSISPFSARICRFLTPH